MRQAPRKPRAARAKANAARGEHSLELAGATYLLRPSMEAVQAIEEELDWSSAQILARANSSALHLADLGVIYAALIRAGAADGDAGDLTRTVSPAGLEPLLYEKGVAGLQVLTALIFLEVITGGRDREGNAIAVAGTKETVSPATAN